MRLLSLAATSCRLIAAWRLGLALRRMTRGRTSVRSTATRVQRARLIASSVFTPPRASHAGARRQRPRTCRRRDPRRPGTSPGRLRRAFLSTSAASSRSSISATSPVACWVRLSRTRQPAWARSGTARSARPRCRAPHRGRRSPGASPGRAPGPAGRSSVASTYARSTGRSGSPSASP